MLRISERNFYIRQLEQEYTEYKKTLTVYASDILSELSDEDLGKLVREQYKKKVDDCDSHLKHMKSL